MFLYYRRTEYKINALSNRNSDHIEVRSVVLTHRPSFCKSRSLNVMAFLPSSLSIIPTRHRWLHRFGPALLSIDSSSRRSYFLLACHSYASQWFGHWASKLTKCQDSQILEITGSVSGNYTFRSDVRFIRVRELKSESPSLTSEAVYRRLAHKSNREPRMVERFLKQYLTDSCRGGQECSY